MDSKKEKKSTSCSTVTLQLLFKMTRMYKKSTEPDLNQRPRDIWFWTWSTVSRSTNWAIGGWYFGVHTFVIFSMLEKAVTILQSCYNSYLFTFIILSSIGGLAQVVERSICIREAPGSIPGFSIIILYLLPPSFHTWSQRTRTEKKTFSLPYFRNSQINLISIIDKIFNH